MNFTKTVIVFLFLFLLHTPLSAQHRIADLPEHIRKSTVTYAVKGDDTLRMDIYRLKNAVEKQPAVLFQFGGSFWAGYRDREIYGAYYRTLAERGFTVVAIDYRLGMKGKKYNLRTLTSKKEGLAEAVQVAVEDLFTATDFLLDHAGEWNIDPDSILASGSSAGAISALQADWILKNRMAGSEILPAGFHYKGIIGFAGGIFSRRGGPKWEYGLPAPTLMFHGSKDRTVPYRTIRFFNIGMFTSKNLSRRMRRAGGEFLLIDLQGKDHNGGANEAMTSGLIFTEWFLDEYIRQGEGRQLVIRVGEDF